MKRRKGLRALAGVVLCIGGFIAARVNPYRETTVMISTGGCRLVTDVIDQGNDDVRGYVVLFHGLSANKKIMAYLAQGFANQNLRVFVPDLPGHGRTAGPFSFERAEGCADAVVQELIRRRAIEGQRTMLAGHSMGGAIAIRVAARGGVAGVIAISPAPMRAVHGIPEDMLPYRNPPALPAHTLAISAAFEPFGIKQTARDLISGDAGQTGKYLLLPHATHVSVLFDPRVVHASQEWTAATLGFPAELSAPSHAALIGSLAGLAGILLLAGPFVRELVGSPQTAAGSATPGIEPRRGGTAAGLRGLRPVLQVAAISFAAVGLLRFWNPLSFVRLYNGSYFASFLLIVGISLLIIHHKQVRVRLPTRMTSLLAALLAGFLLHLLVSGWMDATFAEAWLSWARWARVPVVFVAALAYLWGEELLLGPPVAGDSVRRVAAALTLRLAAFLVLLFGIFVLHSGAILILLLGVYLALFFLFQRMGMDVVRHETESAIAAAAFGAILLAGFCLVIFPVT